MKKFYSKSLMLIASLFISISASAFDFEVDEIYYNSTGNLTCSVTSGDSKYAGDVVIPSTVVYNNQTLSVTSIGSSAFEDCSILTSITIPNSVTSIGSSAFWGCSSLTSLLIPNSVTFMGIYAFWGCSSLTSVTIGNGITSISGCVFSKCSSLTSVIIPNSVTSMGIYAFEGCCSLTSITIPNSVTSIKNYAFNGCSSLTSITIPNSVTSIGVATFSGCSSLMKFIVDSNNLNYSDIEGVLCSKNKTKLISYPNAKGSKYDIPNSVTTITENAFESCSNLTSVTIPNSVTLIREATFYGCSNLTSVAIPNSITLIGKSAFAGCGSLTSVTIPNNVTSIGEEAFYHCNSLTSVTIGESVKTIGVNAFSWCNSITKINSLNPAPPTGCDFMADVYSNATLNIPNGSLSAYNAAAGWQKFKNIKEVDFSGVEQITNDDVKVIVNSNEIAISGVDESAKVEIYNMNGMLIYSGFEKTITAPTAGIYIVKVANKTVKVAIN